MWRIFAGDLQFGVKKAVLIQGVRAGLLFPYANQCAAIKPLTPSD